MDARSPQAFRGYLNRPEVTGSVLRDGWYFTGDLGYIDHQGDLHLVGRVDDMIISGGENVYPQEVESVLLAHPLVKDAAVVGVPDPKWGEKVAAFVVPAAAELNVNALEKHCRENPSLARYKRPRKFIFVDSIPRSPTGKLLRADLKQKAGLLSEGSQGVYAGKPNDH